MKAEVQEIRCVRGNNRGLAVKVALEAFAATDRRHRVLVVITDGEDHEGEVDDAIERAADEGHGGTDGRAMFTGLMDALVAA